jgi:glycerol-3-phosphate acyltransferase PlsY
MPRLEACPAPLFAYIPGVEILGFVLTALASYLVGSIPTGYLVAKAKGVDIRSVGSGNIGATNVFRILGKPAGIFVLLADALKGFLACRLIAFGPGSPSENHAMVAGLFAILGHNFTCWLKFKGGKGIATSAGVLLALAPSGFGIALSVFLIVFFISKYVSLASISAAVALPFGVWWTGGSKSIIGLTTVLSIMAIIKHRANIRRLLAGTESRVGQKKKEPTA